MVGFEITTGRIEVRHLWLQPLPVNHPAAAIVLTRTIDAGAEESAFRLRFRPASRAVAQARPGGPASLRTRERERWTSQGISGAALLIGIFGLIALGTWLRFKREMAQKEMLFQAQKQLLAQFGSAVEIREFLASEEGRAFFDRLGTPQKPPRPSASPLDIAGLTMFTGLVAMALGLFFILTGLHLQPQNDIEVAGLLCLLVGLALFASPRINRFPDPLTLRTTHFADDERRRRGCETAVHGSYVRR